MVCCGGPAWETLTSWKEDSQAQYVGMSPSAGHAVLGGDEGMGSRSGTVREAWIWVRDIYSSPTLGECLCNVGEVGGRCARLIRMGYEGQ